MKLLKLIPLTIFTALICNIGFNQSSKVVGPWQIGLGVNFIDNDGSPTSDLFKVATNWNSLPFPNTLTLDYQPKDLFSFEFNESINSFQLNKIVNGDSIRVNQFFMHMSANGKLHFNALYKKILWFDPYLNIGAGMSIIAKSPYMYPNIGLGANFWFAENLGINIQSSANFKIMSGSSNYLMHMLTLKYRY